MWIRATDGSLYHAESFGGIGITATDRGGHSRIAVAIRSPRANEQRNLTGEITMEQAREILEKLSLKVSKNVHYIDMAELLLPEAD